jgi:hypothetical protein
MGISSQPPKFPAHVTKNAIPMLASLKSYADITTKPDWLLIHKNSSGISKAKTLKASGETQAIQQFHGGCFSLHLS